MKSQLPQEESKAACDHSFGSCFKQYCETESAINEEGETYYFRVVAHYEVCLFCDATIARWTKPVITGECHDF